MSLDLTKLLSQVGLLGQEAVRRQAERARRLPDAQAAWSQAASLSPQSLQERIHKAGDRWRGAGLTSEAVDATFPPPQPPTAWHALGADGSQLYPDRHGIASFYLVNTGSLDMAHGSGSAPEAYSQPTLGYLEADMLDEAGDMIEASMVNGLRDVAELAELSRLATRASPAPTLALLDNGLLLWLALQETDRRRPKVDRLLQAYLKELDRLRTSGTALAGFIDRPRGTNLLHLLELADSQEKPADAQQPGLRRFGSLVDADLMHRSLPPRHRSARFSIISPLNRDFTRRGHEVQFFYLNTGYDDQIARVEVPIWVGDDPDRLDLVHAGLLQECQITGIPYVLVRAHELAVVTQDDRSAFEALVVNALLKQGITPHTSQKSTTKRWTAQRRRHRL